MTERVIRPPTVTKITAETIRDAILQSDLKPGRPLREKELSRSLGVSRGTVREALRLLQEPGLVEIIPHQGAFVSKLSPQTVKEIYTLRELLEPYAVRLALQKNAYKKQDIGRMNKLVKQMGEFEKQGCLFETIKADYKFHYNICKASGHKLLLAVLRNLQSLTRLCMINIKIYRSDMLSDEVQHEKILDAIKEGDMVCAEDIVRRHLLESRDALLRHMAEL